MIAKTPIKHDINPMIFKKLTFSLKNIAEIKMMNIGEEV